MKLISVADLKKFLGDETGAKQDALLKIIIEGISQRFENFVGRKFEQEERTDYFRGGRKNFFVKAYPIATAESVGVTIEDVAKTENLDFWIHHDRGVIEFVDQVGEGDPRSIAITYTGGFAAKSGVLQVPDDLKLACTMQSAFAFRRKRNLGVQAVNMPNGSQNFQAPRSASGSADTLLAEVREILQSYKRMTI